LAERALVTGATGFIGNHLVEQLIQAGVSVTCLIRSTSNISSLKDFDVSFVLGDILEKETLFAATADADVVYHLAGAEESYTNQTYFDVNEGGTRNLIEACAQAPTPPTLIHVSSIAAAGPSDPRELKKESDPPHPVSVYGHSKLAGEESLRPHAGEVPVTIIRPAAVFGEHDPNTLIIIQFVAYGIHLVWGSKPAYYSSIHATDLAKGMILAAKKGERLTAASDAPPGQGIYFLAYEAPTVYEVYGQLIADAFGRKRVRILHVPNLIIWGMAFFNELIGRIRRKPNILTLDKARDLTAGSSSCSVEKANEQLGFSPSATLEERMKQTIQWYRDQGWL
jgi:nucleoside-diphosphate-sugar epimerase